MNAVPLSALLDDAPGRASATTVTGLSVDSRTVVPGGAFLACAGSAGHGLDWLDDAVVRGATVVLWEPRPDGPAPRFPDGVTALEVPGLKARVGKIADRFFGSPSRELRVIGVTGTNGKTSVTHIVAQALQAAGIPCGLVGTLGHGPVDGPRPGMHTTPDAVTVHGVLAELRDAGMRAVAMEVSSHALDQHRVAGVRFDVAVFTNLTRDHLDYHTDFESYGAAKKRLFMTDGLDAAVICVDDPFGRELADNLSRRLRVTEVGVGAGGRAVQVADRRARDDGMTLTLETWCGRLSVETRLLGGFNATNLALGAGVLLECGLALADAAAALSAVRTVPGRMEAFGGGPAPLVIVDYAHTPDALAQVLRAAREHTTGRLICVFGCGGDRDRGKRPMMAATAAAWADATVVTDDNPRTEDGDAIVDDIVAGFPASAEWSVERNRAAAIRTAIAGAGPADVVVVAGKGHEEYQVVGDRRLPFSDRTEVATVLGGQR